MSLAKHDARLDWTTALVGNPNAGKTTIFNALTGLSQRVGNYPGVTVEKRTGLARLPDGTTADILDLPGTYSLVTLSPDEQVVTDVLHGARADTPRPNGIIAVVDASNLARNLFLVSQVLDLRLPVVIALNMVDVAAVHGRPVDVSALAQALGCTVVPIVGHHRKGIRELAEKIRGGAPACPIEYPLPVAMVDEERRLVALFAEVGGGSGDTRSLARRLLAAEPGGDLDALRTMPRVAEAVSAARARLGELGIDPAQADIEARYRWIDGVVDNAVGTVRASAPRRSVTERVDAVVMHRVWGLLIFAAIMTALFTSVFWIAKPLMDGVKDGVGWLALKVGSTMAEGPLRALVVDGVFAGVGAVLVFVPQIALLFLFLAALEDSGYLARAAFLMDRLLSRVGLHGKSFIPLLSSFACAIPGILATRTIETRRNRVATILVAPFMSCSARLPVYALLMTACLPMLGALQQALVLLGLYVSGIVAAALTSLAVKGRLERNRSSAFILELPTYKRPQPSLVFWQVWTNTRAFVTRAGTTIFALSIVLWVLFSYPRLPAADAARCSTDSACKAAQMEFSVAGRAGHTIEPLVRPLGFDWKMGVGLVSAFAAREVFVSTLGIAYSVGNVDENTNDLAKAMVDDRYPDGRRVWSPLVAVSLLAWFVLAMQCLSTMAVVRRETGGWRWPLAQLAYMNVLAYAVCFAIYQVGRRLLGA